MEITSIFLYSIKCSNTLLFHLLTTFAGSLYSVADIAQLLPFGENTRPLSPPTPKSHKIISFSFSISSLLTGDPCLCELSGRTSYPPHLRLSCCHDSAVPLFLLHPTRLFLFAFPNYHRYKSPPQPILAVNVGLIFFLFTTPHRVDCP